MGSKTPHLNLTEPLNNFLLPLDYPLPFIYRENHKKMLAKLKKTIILSGY